MGKPRSHADSPELFLIGDSSAVPELQPFLHANWVRRGRELQIGTCNPTMLHASSHARYTVLLKTKIADLALVSYTGYYVSAHNLQTKLSAGEHHVATDMQQPQDSSDTKPTRMHCCSDPAPRLVITSISAAVSHGFTRLQVIISGKAGSCHRNVQSCFSERTHCYLLSALHPQVGIFKRATALRNLSASTHPHSAHLQRKQPPNNIVFPHAFQ